MQEGLWNHEIIVLSGMLFNTLNSCSEFLRRKLLFWNETISHKKNQNSYMTMRKMQNTLFWNGGKKDFGYCNCAAH